MSVFYECCVLSGRGLCGGLITRPEESYREGEGDRNREREKERKKERDYRFVSRRGVDVCLL
jgi:hypothetical protein